MMLEICYGPNQFQSEGAGEGTLSITSDPTANKLTVESSQPSMWEI